MGQESRGNGSVTLVFAKGTGDMADKNSPWGDQGHTRENPMGSERGREARADKQSGIQLWEEIWGCFLICWKASKTRWLLPNMRTKGQGRRHRECKALQALVWVHAGRDGNEEGSPHPPREGRRQEAPLRVTRPQAGLDIIQAFSHLYPPIHRHDEDGETEAQREEESRLRVEEASSKN